MYVVCVTALLTFTVGTVFETLNVVYGRLRTTADILLYPSPVIFFIMCGFVAFGLASLSAGRVHRYLIGPKPSFWVLEYEIAASSTPSWFRKYVIVSVTLLLMLCILNVRKHAGAGRSGIVEERTLSFTRKFHPYSAIDRVAMSHFYVPATKYSSGHVSKNRSLFVYFKNGTVWSPRESELQTKHISEASLAEYIAERTGVTIVYPDDVLDLPDYAGMAGRLRLTMLVAGMATGALIALWCLRKRLSGVGVRCVEGVSRALHRRET